jgi:3-deoxy-manno-octulosonate cytidylyltransferase (CMP-KDO synthetase)
MAGANDDAAVVIPARYASTRLPAKALADIAGQPMIARVRARACLATLPAVVIVATDDERIREALPAEAVVAMTDPAHTSGSDRVAEVARDRDEGIIVNVQGDLPLLDPALVDALVELLRERPELGMATAAVPVTSAEELADPAAVKVVCARDGRALYFSRAPVPWHRDDPADFAGALHHIGIYAYRRDTLAAFSDLAPTPLETTEKLEQLRALENGIAIGVLVWEGGAPMEVDTPADLERARAALAEARGAD